MNPGWIALSTIALTPAPASAQGVPDTRIPPNAIDRATAETDQRRAEATRAADADRVAAQNAARAASSTQSAPITQSTLTDGVSGLGTRTDTPAPPASAPR